MSWLMEALTLRQSPSPDKFRRKGRDGLPSSGYNGHSVVYSSGYSFTYSWPWLVILTQSACCSVKDR